MNAGNAVRFCVSLCDTLTVSPLKDQYQLHLGQYTGNAGNALDQAADPSQEGQMWAGPGLQDGIKFSTYDQQDGDGEVACIRHGRSGWWFSR